METELGRGGGGGRKRDGNEFSKHPFRGALIYTRYFTFSHSRMIWKNARLLDDDRI